MAIHEPRQALDRFGQGIAGITPGAGTTRLGEAPAAPQSSPLMQALGIGLAGADIYGRIFLVSRTLKRPMFRRGGHVNDGIMTGIVDRTKTIGDLTG